MAYVHITEELGALEWARPTPGREGSCYEYAARWMLDRRCEGETDWLLVHGHLTGRTVLRFDEPYFHAWCVKGRLVYEPTHDTTYNGSFWAAGTGPVHEAEYGFAEMTECLLTFGHYGPWHEDESC